MMNECAKCGSSDVIPDLFVYAGAEGGGRLVFVATGTCKKVHPCHAIRNTRWKARRKMNSPARPGNQSRFHGPR